VAFDYKTLQTTAATRPPDADHYCPECGRPWGELSAERPRPAADPWRAVLLAVVGFALALTFGERAVRADQRETAIQRDLASLTRCLGGVAGSGACPAGKDAEDLRGLEDVAAAAARGQRDCALVATALGLLAVGVGLRATARRRRRQDHPSSTIATVGRLGESLIGLTCVQGLALLLYSVAGQLARGLPLTWDRLDAAADGVLVLVSFLTGSLF
jgi:hypothetical protein